jgi:hypothetical protein
LTYPTKPSTAYSFTDYQASNPTDPLPGNEVDADFAEHKTAIDATIDFIQIALRSDGNLNNGIVRPESLSAATLALMGDVTFAGAWLTATVYAASVIVTESNKTYISLEAHTSGTFATDLAAGKWQQLEGDNASLTGSQTFSGTNEFDGTTNFDGAVDFDGAEDHSGTETHSGTVNFDGAVDFDSTVDMTGATVTVATAAAADNDTSVASSAFVQAAIKLALARMKPIQGLTYANGSDATNDVDIAAGNCSDATGAYLMSLEAALTKRSDAAWTVGTNQGGLDTGAVGNSEYYIWLIARSDTGVVDALFSLSATAPTMPTNYDYKRLIGWVKRSGGTILAFKTYERSGGGLEFKYNAPVLDISLANTLTTARRTDAISVPKGFSVEAIARIAITDASGNFNAVVCCPDETDVAPSPTASPGQNFFGVSAADGGGASEIRVRTSATGTIAARSTLATTDTYHCMTVGFIWDRR